MISEKDFEKGLNKNIDRVTHYESGGDGSGDGGCDCIGLLIGAVRLAGGVWPWTHGSNYTARYRMQNFRSVRNESVLSKNELVFKAKEPGEAGYDLPNAYKNSGDLNDYYHVGVVTSVHPFEITHCTSVPGGIKRDNTLGKWEYAGWLDQVQKDGGDEPMSKQYKVIGGNLFLRRGPSQKSGVLKLIPNGAIVTAHEEEKDGWIYVDYEGTLGYCMAKYLEPCDELDDDSIAAAIETAFGNVYATLDELKALVMRVL